MSEIKIAISGIGNCASSLIQGLSYYKNPDKDVPGLMHDSIGSYCVSDVKLVAGFDIDARKVGIDVSEAIFSPPNNTKVFCREVPDLGVIVKKGPVLDGFPKHMLDYKERERFVVDDSQRSLDLCEVVHELEESGAEILINYMPVGSQQATEFYAESALIAGCGFINCMPVFICSDDSWIKRFEERDLPCLGDDIKAQLGATIVHRVLTRLFSDRGVRLDRTYQLNFGGNTDFMTMLARERLASKKISKTEAVQSQLPIPLEPENIHIGPSDYVPWQKDNKVCFIRMEGSEFGEVSLNLELRLSVEDSPNSAGCVIDAIRLCRVGLDRKIAGCLESASSYLMKHPHTQYSDSRAREMVEEFIRGDRER